MSETIRDTTKVAPLRKTQPCPECKKPSTRESYPFCSERCRSLDLSRWLRGSYAIPVSEDEEKAETSYRAQEAED